MTTMTITEDFMDDALPGVPYHVVLGETGRALVRIPFPAPQVGPTDGVLVIVADIHLRRLSGHTLGDFALYSGVAAVMPDEEEPPLDAVVRTGAKLPILTARAVGGSIYTDLTCAGLYYRS